MNRSLALLGILFCTSGIPPTLHAADWPQYLGPDRNGVSNETDWNRDWAAREPTVLWKADVGAGCSSIAIADGRAYTMGHSRGKDRVLCLDAATGKKIWEHRYPQELDGGLYQGGPSATPTVDGEHVYTVSKNGDLLCLASATGEVLWAKNYLRDFGGRKQMYGWAASPLVRGGKLFVDPGGPGAAAVALDKLSGETLWQSGDESPGYASPVHARLSSTPATPGE
ncbi:MAG: PQQ-binding-like beta-propeller repeat protein, partial [Verrucomicrobiales bacterium]